MNRYNISKAAFVYSSSHQKPTWCAGDNIAEEMKYMYLQKK
ncbi:MAG: hypothetical protein WKG06_41875 [Segetibacter sp.]